MIVSLNYTWLIVGGLAVWYLATGWLPTYLPGTGAVWPLAVGMVLLYALGLLLAEAIRTRLAGIFSAAWPRSIHLFPFGAAAAYPLRALAAGPAARTALAAPVVMALLGGVYGVASSLLPGPSLGVAVLQALAFSHLAVAVLNLIPGLPLAGGWFLIAFRTWMSNDREGGLALARRLGLVAAIVLAGAGVVVFLQSGGMAPGLIVVALAWAIREGGVEVERRASTRQVMETLTAGELMQQPTRVIAPGDTLADVLWGTDKVAADAVLAVLDGAGQFQGLLPVALTDDTLQGTWAHTKVETVMIPAAAFTGVRPTARLAEVLVAFARQLSPAADKPAGDTAQDPGYVPVIEQGRLRGLISRTHVSEYEGLGTKVGVQEAAALAGLEAAPRSRRTWAGLLIGGVAAVLVLTLLAPRAADPTRAAGPAIVPGSGTITFGDHTPETDSVLGRGDVPITLVIDSAAPVLSVTMTLQGEALTVTLDPPTGGTHVIASATAQGFLLGPYRVQVDAQAEGGLTAHTTWEFRVVPGLTPDETALDEITPGPSAPTPAPTLTPRPVTPPVNDATHRFFPQTGYTVAGDFLAFWQSHGRLAIFGYPLTDALPTPDPTGGTTTVQTFERARMEQHGTGPVLLALLGLAVHPLDPAVAPIKGARYFPETGHNLNSGFREFWEKNGGLAIFGYPISEEMPATIGDQSYNVQYFERARFEYHPEWLGTPWSITLSPLGQQVLQQQP